MVVQPGRACSSRCARCSVYVRRWRAVRASGSPRAAAEAPVWRLCCFLASTADRARRARLADRLARRPALRGAHGPAHAAARHRADPRHPRLTKVLLRPVTRSVSRPRAPRRPLAHPAFAVALYVGVIWAWHVPRRMTSPAPRRHPRGRAPQLPARRLALLVAPDLADPRPHATWRDGPDRLHGLEQAVRRRARDGARLRPHRALPRLRPQPGDWGLSPLDDQAWPA